MRKLSLIRRRKRTLGPEPDNSVASSENWIPKTVGMVSASEMAFYCESSARYAGREGKIVDLGCWMGATSIALARGLLPQGSKDCGSQERVFGFDVFQWEDWMPAKKAYCVYSAGESFLPEARRMIRDYGGGRVDLIKADLRRYKWDGGPIKILLVDAMKSENLAVQIARTFFPSLSPGALLIHQDFKHYFTGWIHLIQYRLRNYFQFDRSVPPGTVAFQVVQSLPPEVIDHATEFVGLLNDEIDSAFRYSLQLVRPEERANIAAAHVMLFVHLKRKDAATQAIESYRPTGMLQTGEFPKALHFFSKM